MRKGGREQGGGDQGEGSRGEGARRGSRIIKETETRGGGYQGAEIEGRGQGEGGTEGSKTNDPHVMYITSTNN